MAANVSSHDRRQYSHEYRRGTRFPSGILSTIATPAVGDGSALLAASAGEKAPGEGVEVRVAPWGAIKILDGPASDPHNLTPPDVIELEPDVWMRLAAGITSWQEEKDAGRITAVGERDDLSDLLPLV